VTVTLTSSGARVGEADVPVVADVSFFPTP
jgi:hypothetical protein